LEARVKKITDDLESRIDALGKGNYPSCCFQTPQGNAHTVYANGKIKPEGESTALIMVDGLSVDAQVAAFQKAADLTFECVRHEKPEGRDRVIWRRMPEASRGLREDGLCVRINLRLGWDKIDG
jgi:hypothetical protein